MDRIPRNLRSGDPVGRRVRRTAGRKPRLRAADTTASHSKTSISIVNELRNNHYYPRRKIDDSVSAQVFDKYIDRLDSDRAYFLATDVENLDEKYRSSLDEALKQGDLAPAFDIFNLFQERLIDRLEYVLAFIDHGLDTFDFTVDESLEIDRENAPWPRDRNEMDSLWRKRIKAWTLEMLLDDREIDDIEETLAKRYRNRLRQLTKTKPETRSEEAFQMYINAFTNTYDPHTEYFSPRNYAQFNINMSLSLEGSARCCGRWTSTRPSSAWFQRVR